MSDRLRLPNRRPQVTERVTVGQSDYDISVGFVLRRALGLVNEGADKPSVFKVAIEPREVFIEGPKPGSDMAFVLHDGAVLISILRQYGVPIAELRHSMSRIPLDSEGRETAPASAIGAAVDLLARLEAESGQ